MRHNLLTPGHRELGCAWHSHHNGLALFRPQRRRQLGHPRVRAPGRLIPRSCRHQQQHGGARQPLDQRPQPGFRCGIDPVHVLHGEHQRPLLRLLADQMPQERKRPGSPVQDSTAPELGRHRQVQELAHQGHLLRGADATRVETALDSRRLRCGMVPLHERAELPQEVTHRGYGMAWPYADSARDTTAPGLAPDGPQIP